MTARRSWVRRMSGAAGRALAADRDRWALWLPVVFALGIALYFALGTEPPWWTGPAAVIGALVLGLWVARGTWDRGGIALAAVLALGLLAAGFAAAQIRTMAVAAPMLEKRIGPTAVTGRVVRVETFPRGNRVTLERPAIIGVAADRIPAHVRVRLRGDAPGITPGDWIRLRAILTPPSPPTAPGAFDFQRQSYFRALGAVGFGVGTPDIIARAETEGWRAFPYALSRLRQAITARVQAVLPGRTGAVAAALMTGERSAIPPDLMDSIRDSGLAHLLAISGLHIGLVAGIVFVGLRALLALMPPLALRYATKKWAAATAILAALAYALIAGATVPTQRAFLMVGLMLLAVLLDRRGLSIRLVAWAALVILVLQPESLLSASFQMSFAAVVALIAVYESIERRRLLGDPDRGPVPAWAKRAGLYLSGVLLTTLIAGAATAPFAIYHFNRFADYGLAANLIAVPATALWVMPWAVAAFLLMPLGAEAVALLPMGWGVDVVIAVAETVAHWPGAVTLVPAMAPEALAAVVLGGLWLCLWRGRWRYWGSIGIVAGVVLAVAERAPDVLVDGQGRLMAARGAEGGFTVSSTRAARFERETWLRREGQEAAAPWPAAGESKDGRLSCDSSGCLYRLHGLTVALTRNEAALMEDCWAADVVVATVPIRRRCPAPAGTIDRFDLWRDGAHAIWLDGGGGIEIRSVNGERGRRPWVVRPKPKAKAGAS